MEMTEWLETIKGLKKTFKETAFLGEKARSDKGKKIWEMFNIEKCKKCSHEKRKSVTVHLKEGKHLSVFEAGMLYAVYCLKKLPYDYAQYHKCIAGKRFIENIDRVIN